MQCNFGRSVYGFFGARRIKLGGYESRWIFHLDGGGRRRTNAADDDVHGCVSDDNVTASATWHQTRSLDPNIENVAVVSTRKMTNRTLVTLVGTIVFKQL